MKKTAMQQLLEEVILEREKSISVEFREALDFVITAIETDYKEMEKKQQGYSEEEVTILLQNIINEIEIRKQNIISKSETISVHLLEGGCMAFESSQDVVKEQVKQFKNK